MGISYTTAGAQQKTKTLEQWAKWVASLKSGDKVLFQMFVERGNSCLDSQVECWRFFDARFEGNRVYYNGDQHPLKDGYSVYWGSDTRWGDVFDARVVPWYSDIAPKDGEYCRDGHAPIFDENWTPEGTCRHLILLSRGPSSTHAYEKIKCQFPRCYARGVRGGELLTVFAYWEDVAEEKINEIKGAKYLYSEPLHY